MSVYARIENGIICELFSTDGDITEMFSPELVWIDITKAKPMPAAGWSYNDGVFSAPVIDYKLEAEAERTYRLNVASEKMSLWQTKLLLGRASDEDKSNLNLWLDYVDELNAMNLDDSPDITWPAKPE